MICKSDVLAGETALHIRVIGAEGATAPETLRQKDR